MNYFNLYYNQLRRFFLLQFTRSWNLLFEILSTFSLLIIFFLVDRHQSSLFGSQLGLSLDKLKTTYFSYVSLNLAISSLAHTALGSLVAYMTTEKHESRWEMIMASPLNLTSWACYSGGLNFFYSIFQMTLVLSISYVLGNRIPSFSVLDLLLILLFGMFALWSLSVFSLCFSLLTRKGDPFGFMLAFLFDVIGGVYAPVEVLPQWLQKISNFLPITPVIQLVQGVVYRSQTIHSEPIILKHLVMMTVVYFPLALFALRITDYLCRRKGYYCLSH